MRRALLAILATAAAEIRRYDLRDGRRQRTKAPNPIVSATRDGARFFFSKGEDREATSGQPCSIGFTDVVGQPSKPRTCTIGLLRGSVFR